MNPETITSTDWQLPASYRRMVLFRVETLIVVGILIELLFIAGGAYSARIGIILSVGLTLISVAIWLTWRHYYVLSATLILSIVLLLALGLALLGQGLHDIALLIFPANLVLGGLLLRRKAYWLLTLATLLAVVVIGAAEAQHWIAPTVVFEAQPRIVYEVLTLLVILSLIAAMVTMLVQGIVVFFSETQKKSQEMTRLYQQLQTEVNERRQAQSALQTLNEELEQRILLRTHELESSNRELESFSYSVSHDLRAPLRSINGFASALHDDHQEQLNEEGRHLLNRVIQSAQKMDQLISDLLRFARVSRTTLHDEAIDTNAMVGEIIVELREQRRFEGQIILDTLPPCRGDSALLRQVWINLIGNAMKFSQTRDIPRITIAGQQRDKEWVYTVADNGVGFDMAYHGKLFGVFHRLHTRDQFEGTGIGLALCRRIVERHGGNIDASSVEGEGATFHFGLPIYPLNQAGYSGQNANANDAIANNRNSIAAPR